MKKKILVSLFLLFAIFVCYFGSIKAEESLPNPDDLTYTELVGDPFSDRLFPTQLMSIWPGGHYRGYWMDDGRSSFEYGSNLNVSWAHFEYAKIILEINAEINPLTNYAYPIKFYNTRSYANNAIQRGKDSLIKVDLYRRTETDEGYKYGKVDITKDLWRDNRVHFYSVKKYRGSIVVSNVETFEEANRIEIDLGDYLKHNDLAIAIPWVETTFSGDLLPSVPNKDRVNATFSSSFEVINMDGSYMIKHLYRDGYYYAFQGN